jgi:lipoprotein-releasing system permease protein
VNLPLFIAKRYFVSKKSQRAINIISLISVVGVMVGTCALITVLSVFNGFEHLVISLYNSFDPDIKITAERGKFFPEDQLTAASLQNITGVQYVCPVFEENALVRYGEKQTLATIKGVGENFSSMSGVDSMIVQGTFRLSEGERNVAVVGGGIAYNLQLDVEDPAVQLDLYVPRKDASDMMNPDEAFNRRFISPVGIFAIQQDFDSKYILVPLRFARDLFDAGQQVTAYEVGLTPGADAVEVKQRIQQQAGSAYRVQDRLEQHDLLNRIMSSEKWAVFLILTFILLIATFNVIGSLTMLIIEKQHDIAVLHSMGAGEALIRNIFLAEGFFITAIGAGAGIVLGTLICLLQQHYGLVQLSSSGTFVIDAYPVKMEAMDFVYVTATVLAIGFVAAWYPARRLVQKKLDLKMISGEE